MFSFQDKLDVGDDVWIFYEKIAPKHGVISSFRPGGRISVRVIYHDGSYIEDLMVPFHAVMKMYKQDIW